VARRHRDVGLDVALVDPDLTTLVPDTVTARPTDRHDPHAATGTVITFHPRRGFGFIDAGGERDLFVHHSNLATQVRRGQRVRFEIRQGRRGPEAVSVQPI
jgi:cold shock protein